MQNIMQKNIFKKLFRNVLFVPIAIIVFGVLIAGSVIFTHYIKCQEGKINAVSSQDLSDKIIKFVNENLLNGQATAAMESINKEDNLYKIKLKISTTGESAQVQEIETYATLDGKFWFPQGFDLTSKTTEPAGSTSSTTIGTFSISDEEICKENGKPIIYFFGSNTCPHCKWEHPIFESVVAKFNGLISFHNNMDATDKDTDVFSKYSTGGIPTEVLGCKYYRVGSGEKAGEEAETKNLTALICKLTDNQPAEVCNEVKDLIDQIKD